MRWSVRSEATYSVHVMHIANQDVLPKCETFDRLCVQVQAVGCVHIFLLYTKTQHHALAGPAPAEDEAAHLKN